MRPDLFPGTKPPRAKPRVMMHFTDVGNGPGGDVIATFECRKCGYESDWLICDTYSQVRRGEPCPKCNPDSPQEASDATTEVAVKDDQVFTAKQEASDAS